MTFEHIQAAAGRLREVALRTPLLNSPALDKRLDARVFVKAENLQRIGAFKFRGAYNRLAQLGGKQRKKGVVAYSSGNHAQGVAYAAHLLGMPATIVMPADAPRVKMEGTRNWGATVRTYDRHTESREAIAEDLANSSGATLVPAFDDPDIIAGQGTVGLELAGQLEEAARNADLLLVPCGGGGLLAGVSTAMRELSPETRIFGVEPENYDDHRRSLKAGRRVRIKGDSFTRCDALAATIPGEITWSVNKRNVNGFVTVSEDETGMAISVAARYLKTVLEPGGAVALAAILHEKLPVRGKTVAIVASGGNIDAELFAAYLRDFPI
ncbi:MAG: threonine/serine dehydratase [Gammaproteobacteria bacterium]|nr:threonine/serine dehydratase [Gammaproteobacteria bacterium]